MTECIFNALAFLFCLVTENMNLLFSPYPSLTVNSPAPHRVVKGISPLFGQTLDPLGVICSVTMYNLEAPVSQCVVADLPDALVM